MELCELKKGDLIDITFGEKRFVAEIRDNHPGIQALAYRFRNVGHWVNHSDYYSRMRERNIVYLIEDE